MYASSRPAFTDFMLNTAKKSIIFDIAKKTHKIFAGYKFISYFCIAKQKRTIMPEICRFFGIIISLYWRDHNPPHIHFTYGNYECSISVLDRIVDGQAPAKVIAKVNQWMDLHEAEILSLWEKAQRGDKIDKIEPLK